MKDYYTILNLKRFASMGEVRRSYRQLVQQYHPDVNPDPSAAIIIREVNEAYEVLGDVQKKRTYDYGLITPYEQTIIAQPEPTPPIRYRDPYFRRKSVRPVFIRPRQYDLIIEYC
jgi:curved DNA-binding protein CbpA